MSFPCSSRSFQGDALVCWRSRNKLGVGDKRNGNVQRVVLAKPLCSRAADLCVLGAGGSTETRNRLDLGFKAT